MSNANKLLLTLRRCCADSGRLTLDSRRVNPGDVFVAVPGAQRDGRDFIDEALSRGAAAVIAESAVAGASLHGGKPLIKTPQLSALLPELAALYHGQPAQQLWLAGVTGTNGKTSVTYWIASALAAAGQPCGLIGTLGCGLPPQLDSGVNTTPDAPTLHAALADFVAAGAAAAALEVTSIGLAQGRVAGVRFNTAVLTNLSRDHLDYHGDMRSYGEAKALLFEQADSAVINLDDPFGRQLAKRLRDRMPLIGFSLGDAGGVERVLRAADIVCDDSGVAFSLDGAQRRYPLIGRFNIANLLAVIAVLELRGLERGDILPLLAQLQPPPGRMQTIGGGLQPLIVIDYAHTPEALSQALQTLAIAAAARNGRLLCVFGCGGDRDAGKRPLMGGIASDNADIVILTSDNPRSEAPQDIIAAIRGGMKKAPLIEADRAAAINQALAMAADVDVLLIAGKGHESGQECNGVKTPFSDLDVARAALAKRSC